MELLLVRTCSRVWSLGVGVNQCWLEVSAKGGAEEPEQEGQTHEYMVALTARSLLIAEWVTRVGSQDYSGGYFWGITRSGI